MTAPENRQALFARLPEVAIFTIKAARRIYKCRSNADAIEKLFSLAAKQFLAESGITQHFNFNVPLDEDAPRSLMGDMWRMVDILTNGDKASYQLVDIPSGSIWEKRGFKGPVILCKDETLTETGHAVDQTKGIKSVPDWLESGADDES